MLGVARTDITPPQPVPLAGFEHRRGEFTGVIRPLYARVLLFEEGERRALLVSADLIWWGEDQVENLRRLLEERWDLQRGSVILHATHNHSGPQTSGRFSSRLGKPDPAYPEILESRVLAAVEEASGSLETVTVERGRGECRTGINRRRRVAGRIEMAPNEAGPTDPEVTVVRFRTPSSATKAVLVHHACHPTTTDDEQISSEFPGVAMELVEGQVGGGAVAAYLQGCCGDLRPALVREGQFYRGGDAEVRELGERLAAEALSIMRHPMRGLSPSPLGGRQTTIPLPLQTLPDEAELEAASRRSGVIGEWGRLLRRDPGRLRRLVPLEITLLDLAGGLSLLAMNGEAVVEYGLFIKRRFAGKVIPLPYSNGMVGYVPTARQVGEGGYEAKESIFYFGLPAPFAASLEREIRDGLIEFVEENGLSIRPEPLKTEKVDLLEVRVYENRAAMGRAAGTDVAEAVRKLLSQKERVRMVFAAAPSQSETLRALANEPGIDWSRVVAFHMDEYVGLSSEEPQSFGRFLSDALFDIVEPGEVHFIDGTGHPIEECERYAALLGAVPIDIVCLGVGENGHIAFNDPPVADFGDPRAMKPVRLDEASRRQQVNDGLFPSIEEVPTHAVTLTIPTLMSGAHLFCAVPGPSKRRAVGCALRGPVTTECPASVLRRHPNCVFYTDVDAHGDEGPA